jgi:hypothetical protein
VKTEGIGDFTHKSIGDQVLVPAHPLYSSIYDPAGCVCPTEKIMNGKLEI